MKTCSKCGEEKPLDEFSRQRRAKGGRQPRCKACFAEYRLVNREALAKRKSDYYEVNRETILTRKAEYHARPEVKAQTAAYRAANPHLGWESNTRARAKKFGYTIVIESFTREELYERWGTACYHCGSEDGTTLDHWPQPVSRGGEHNLENCRPSCADCQQRSWRPDFTPKANHKPDHLNRKQNR